MTGRKPPCSNLGTGHRVVAGGVNTLPCRVGADLRYPSRRVCGRVLLAPPSGLLRRVAATWTRLMY